MKKMPKKMPKKTREAYLNVDIVNDFKNERWDKWQRTSADGRKIYTLADLESPDFLKAVKKAKERWITLCEKYYSVYGDCGSATLGNGIEIVVRPPRCRAAYTFRIIGPPWGFGQGCGVYDETASEVVGLLLEQGIDAWYNFGRMD